MSATIRGIRFLFLAWLLPVCLFALHEGQSPESVLEELGNPNGTRMLANGELWVYSGDISLEFENGRLIRSTGLDLLPPPEAFQSHAPVHVDEKPPESEASDPDRSPPEATGDPSVGSRTAEDDELMETAESISHPERLLEEEWEASHDSSSLMETILSIVVPVLLQWGFLLIAFKFTGAEASKLILLGISIVDRLVILGVQWIFMGWLGFPMTFHADTLASVLVMLALITSFTHAKRLDSAIKVVVVAKVAALLAGWLFFMFLLSQF